MLCPHRASWSAGQKASGAPGWRDKTWWSYWERPFTGDGSVWNTDAHTPTRWLRFFAHQHRVGGARAPAGGRTPYVRVRHVLTISTENSPIWKLALATFSWKHENFNQWKQQERQTQLDLLPSPPSSGSRLPEHLMWPISSLSGSWISIYCTLVGIDEIWSRYDFQLFHSTCRQKV